MGKRSYYIDILNIVACFAVVLLHSTGSVFQFNESPTWFLSMVLQAIGHFSIPLFFMLSGATLLGYRDRYSTKEYFKKRFFRIFLPFILWSAIMLVWKYCIGDFEIQSFQQVVGAFLNNKIQNIYWFFYDLIPIYFCIPVISLIIKNKKTMWLFFALCFINTALLPLFTRFVGSIYLNFPIANNYIGYVLLGWLLANTDIPKKIRWLLYGGALVGIAGMVIGTYFISKPLQTLDTQFMDYNSICCYLIAAGVFVLVKSINWSFLEKPLLSKVVSNISGACFGIYLVQMIVFYYVEKWLPMKPVVMMTAGCLLVYTICLLIVVAVRKIPILRKIFP